MRLKITRVLLPCLIAAGFLAVPAYAGTKTYHGTMTSNAAAVSIDALKKDGRFKKITGFTVDSFEGDSGVKIHCDQSGDNTYPIEATDVLKVKSDGTFHGVISFGEVTLTGKINKRKASGTVAISFTNYPPGGGTEHCGTTSPEAWTAVPAP